MPIKIIHDGQNTAHSSQDNRAQINTNFETQRQEHRRYSHNDSEIHHDIVMFTRSPNTPSS